MKNHGLRLLLLCLLIAGAAVGTAFLLLSLLHAELNTPAVHAFDLKVQAAVHGLESPGLTVLMRLFTLIGSTEIFIPSLIIAVILLLRLGEKERGQRLVRKRQVSGTFALGVSGALILNDTFKQYFHRVRPKPAWALATEHTFSFPSGHSLFSMVLYGLIAYTLVSRRSWRPRHVLIVACAAAMIACIGLSRIYLGVHWPTDVLAGYTTGAIWLTGVILIDRRWRTHGRRMRNSG